MTMASPKWVLDAGRPARHQHARGARGIFIYLGLFLEGADAPDNKRLSGDRFANTDNGVATFTVSVDKKGRYRLRTLTDDLPELDPHGPEPYLFSRVFEVK
jgi:hypothetical protein